MVPVAAGGRRGQERARAGPPLTAESPLGNSGPFCGPVVVVVVVVLDFSLVLILRWR